MSSVPLKTGIPDIIDSNVINRNTLDPQYVNFLDLARQYDELKYQNDPIMSEVDFWENLANSSPVDLSEIDPGGEFVAWWLDKYRKAHPKVKEELEIRMPYIEETILKTISESIGLIFSQYLTPQRRSMHYADEFDPTPDNPNDPSVTPFPYNNIIDDKLDFDTRKNILGLSKRTEAIFGRNMTQVIYGVDGLPTLAHGSNLVTDYVHYRRLGEIHSDIMIEIGRLAGGAYKLVYWLTCNKIGNKQEAVPQVHTLAVENTEQEVDALMNTIQDTWRPFTMKDIIS